MQLSKHLLIQQFEIWRKTHNIAQETLSGETDADSKAEDYLETQGRRYTRVVGKL